MRKLRHEEIPRPDPDALRTLPRHPICVLVDNIRSIYNVGSIFRTSDAALVEHIYITGVSGTPENRSLYKTSLGAEDWVPWSYERDPVPVVEQLKAQGYTIAALEITDTPSRIEDVRPEHFPLCLILGNELFGVRDELLDLCDLALELPQHGSKQSLNVSVAYGIAVYGLLPLVEGSPLPSKR